MTVWKYCDTVDSNDRICEGNYAVNGVKKAHPRTWMNNVYGRYVDTAFWGVSCNHESQGATHLKMQCPHKYHLKIKKAQYGRWNSFSCTNQATDKPGSCEGNYVDLTDVAKKECGGNQTCFYRGATKEDPCPGVSKYTQLEWFCKAD